jgi:N-acetylglutamate synthase-like GNAT family acetyltransferase
MQLSISHIRHTSPRYQEVWELREAVLRKPLGLSLRNENLSRDERNIFFIAEHEGRIVGCVLMEEIDKEQVQLRAMAVYDEYQGKGVGRQLVHAFERYAWQHAYHKIVLHARKVALGFYKGMDYSVTSGEFVEVGIPHYMMEKANPATLH